MTRVLFASINARGVRVTHKRNLILNGLENSNYDDYLLQETHVSCKRPVKLFSALLPW